MPGRCSFCKFCTLSALSRCMSFAIVSPQRATNQATNHMAIAADGERRPATRTVDKSQRGEALSRSPSTKIDEDSSHVRCCGGSGPSRTDCSWHRVRLKHAARGELLLQARQRFGQEVGVSGPQHKLGARPIIADRWIAAHGNVRVRLLMLAEQIGDDPLWTIEVDRY